MRMLLVGLLSTTLIGCSCLAPQLASLDGCIAPGCFNKIAEADPPVELKPAPFTANPATAKVKTAAAPKEMKPRKPTSVAARTAKPSSAATTAPKPSSGQPANESSPVDEPAPAPIMKPEMRASGQPSNEKITVAAKRDVPASGQPADNSDPVLKKARTTVAAKLQDPASAEFEGMKRAMRKNTFGQPVDTICGHVRVKKASGEDTGERAFLYLVKEDAAYVVEGNAESAAAAAYRNICMNSGFARKGFPPAKERE